MGGASVPGSDNLHGCHGDVPLRQTELGRFGNNRKFDLKLGHLGHGPVLEETKIRTNDLTFMCPSWEGAEPSADLEGEWLQDVSLDGGGQQDDGRLWVVLVPVDVDALTLQQLQAALVWEHLNTPETTAADHLQAGEFNIN